MTALWTQVERRMREAAYASLDDDPQILLETDAWFNVDADLFYARLIGLEDEIVRDGLQVAGCEPLILVPIHRQLTMADFSPVDVYAIEPLRTARYHLQSGHALIEVSGEFNPPVEHLRLPTETARVAYLRYRRRI